MITIEQQIRNLLIEQIKKHDIPFEGEIVIEKSKDPLHGDYASNVAMQLTRVLKRNPREIASLLISDIDSSLFDKIEIAGPGFINFFVKQDSLKGIIEQIVTLNDHYGENDFGNHQKVNVEFVSANPTGDLHLGHARNAAIGDSICRILEKCNFDVTREYYINDAGNQIDNLAKSIRARYHEILENNPNYPFPEDGYHGEDIYFITKQIIDEVGDKYLNDSEEGYQFFKKRGRELELDKLINDLKMFRVHFDVFSSELDIRNQGAIEQVLEKLKNHIYLQDGAYFLKTTDYGDDKDRVLIKKDGAYTYLLPDIAYHQNKLNRNFDLLIDCLGADHHGYIARMKAALEMLGYSSSKLEIELIQMVRLFKDGEEYKMSKRTGNAVSLKELCEETSIDSVRYFFVSRASSSHLDYDIDASKKMEASNPVYYAQYAHARLASLLEQGKDITLDLTGDFLNEKKEKELLKIIIEFPLEIVDAAKNRAPYKITNYIQKLATAINEFYTVCRVIDRNNLKLSSARLGLCLASKITLKNALDLVGVAAPERM